MASNVYKQQTIVKERKEEKKGKKYTTAKNNSLKSFKLWLSCDLSTLSSFCVLIKFYSWRNWSSDG